MRVRTAIHVHKEIKSKICHVFLLCAGDVIVTEQETHDGVPYYYWEVKPHHLVTATAVGNRLFMFYSTSLSRQWRKGEKDLRMTQKSFKVPPK